MLIGKVNFRDQVRDLLLSKMQDGSIELEERLSLAKLARELDVSVTPIREALTQLEHSKILISIPNRGFVIPSLTKEEATNLYELVFTLETLAVEKTQYDIRIIKHLEKQQLLFEKAKNGLERIQADMKFHTILTSGYNNVLVQQLLSEIKTRIFFYEKDFMENQTFDLDSNTHHDDIINFLKTNSKSKAIKVLKINWMQILNYINL